MILFLFLGGLLAFSSGSKILFEANPDMIQANLTQTLSMRCSLNDTADAFVGGVVGKRDVTQTASNMQVVTSLVITRNNGEHVATIFGTQPAKALADLSNLHVDGDISGGVGERGYIELTWQYPSTDQVGEYVCEINAVDNQGHNVVFSTSAEIGERQPTIGELTHLLIGLQGGQASTLSKLDELLQNLTQLEALFNSTKTAHQSHTEVGVLKCGDSNSWGTHEQYLVHLGGSQWPGHYVIKHHAFNTTYSSIPKVKVGVTMLDHQNFANTRYDVTVLNVDQNGFDVKCETWNGPTVHGHMDHSHIYDIEVSWISTDE